MSRYIDADALSIQFNALAEHAEMAGLLNMAHIHKRCLRMIAEAPTADVEKVRHSRIKWVNRPVSAQYSTVTDEFGEKHYGKVCDRIENNPVGYCGECGKRLDDTFMNYCPNCGAKMDLERRSENEG